MEALGGTSERKALPARWYEGALSNRGACTRLPGDVSRSGKRAALWRRLASLNLGQITSDLCFALEICMTCVLGVVAVAMFSDSTPTLGKLTELETAPLLLVPIGLALLVRLKGLYAFERLVDFSSSIAPVLLFACLVFCLAILGTYTGGVGGAYSGAWLSTWMLFTLLGLATLRASASWICGRLLQAGAIQQSVAVFGDVAATRSACQSLTQSGDLIRVTGVFGPLSDNAVSPGAHFDGDLEALVEGALANTFDTIVIAADRTSNDEFRRLLARFERLPCAVQIFFTFKNKMARPKTDRGITLLDVQAKPISGWGRLFKRLLDVTLAGVGLLCLAPFLLLVAAAIKLDSPGPVFFTQRRHGLNRKVFRIFKLRTMTVMEEGDSAVQAARHDPRVTRVGALLRKTSVDELPQLLNVLSGEMSLVGPRPHPLSLDDQYADQLDIYSSRHKVKPGITGWAQINGHRGPTDQPGLMQRRVQHDLDYIDNWSIWLDLKILVATPFLGVIHKNAI